MRNKLKKIKMVEDNNLFLNTKKVIYKYLKPITVLVFAFALLSGTLVAGLNSTISSATTNEAMVTCLNLSSSFAKSQENLVLEDGGKKQDLKNLSKKDTQNRPRS